MKNMMGRVSRPRGPDSDDEPGSAGRLTGFMI